MTTRLKALAFPAIVSMTTLNTAPSIADAQTLRVVMHSDVKIVDPIWTTAYITRNHSYMIYDTLFAMDEKGEIKPQMVDTYDVSDDKLTYVFKLRDGLLWHDGQPVTAEDCIASIKRWSARDSAGQKLFSFVESITAKDDRSFAIKLKSPTNLPLLSLGKPSSNVPFMMPKRVADTEPTKQIADFTGSGPFVFKKDEWTPRDKIVYVKFDKYKPRSEPASGLAGGKVVKLSRVEWIAIADQQQAVNALMQGELDFVEAPPLDLLPLIKESRDVKLAVANPLGFQYVFRPNHLRKPFDNPKIRQALFYALNQKDFLEAAVGDAEYYKPCKAYFVCGTPFGTEKGMEGLLDSNFAKSKALLKEAEYDDTPIVLFQPTDVNSLANLAPVAKSLMEKGGFKVDMQSMDWQTMLSRLAKREWNAFATFWAAADVLNPVMMGYMNASCDKAATGWPCDAELERIRDEFARAATPEEQKAATEAAQLREREAVTHIPLGQFFAPAAMSTKVTGVLKSPVPVFWNIEKK